MVTFGSHQLLVGVAGNVMKLLSLQRMFTAAAGYPEQVYFYLDRFIGPTVGISARMPNMDQN